VADEPGPGDVATPTTLRPAYYAAGRTGGWRDWWTLLHPPYTLWHLSYVVIGACLAPHIRVDRLVATVLAFLLAVGLAAHALDELHGRPLRTTIASRWLVVVAVLGIGGAVALGAVGVERTGWTLLPFIVVGPVLVVTYNLDMSVVHKDVVFAAAWGTFPVLTAYVAQTQRLAWAPVLAALAAFGLSAAQRSLSTPARLLRRRTLEVTGTLTSTDGAQRELDRSTLLEPLERALNALATSVVLFATALALARLT
jgi:hypothetical protein